MTALLILLYVIEANGFIVPIKCKGVTIILPVLSVGARIMAAFAEQKEK